MNPVIEVNTTILRYLIAFVVLCFGFSTASEAVLPPPPPDGGYSGENTAEGTNALFNLTSGVDNTAMGFNALFSNTIGIFNTAAGAQALFNNTRGSNNTAVGAHALLFNITGDLNTAIGTQALYYNDRGSNNTAVGLNALFSNENGRNNTGVGYQVLAKSSSGTENTAIGSQAMIGNVGSFNTATGFQAMWSGFGFYNTATGFRALSNNLGNGNTATGNSALLMNTDGKQNTATGTNALRNNTTGEMNVAQGGLSLSNNTSGSSNIALGFNAASNLTTGSNNIDIGAFGVVDESNTIRIGRPGLQDNTFIAGIFGVAMSGSVVVVNSSGKLGVTTSSARFKDDIEPMGKASDVILRLNPVTFRYKEQMDPDRIPQFGLIAEDVEKVNPDLVVRDKDGKAYSVRYEQVNAMLLNEFLKEHKTVEEQGGTIARLEKQVEALTAGLEKVSAQLEASKSAPQLVNNP
jgi:trimeric autotransporter adhesin